MMAPKMEELCAVILAAGKGTRMKSSLPKVLHPILGKPMIGYVLDRVEELGVRDVVLVLGHGSDEVAAVVGSRARVAVQEPQRGTGHAVQVAAPHMQATSRTVLILSGDQPLIETPTLRRFVEQHQASGAPISVLTAVLPWPNDLGRIVRGDGGDVVRIVEAREATEAVRSLREVNLGTYCVDRAHLETFLPRLGRPNTQNEIYLTDLVPATVEAGLRVQAVDGGDPYLSIGVNSRKELADVTRVLRERINERWMLEGVTIVDPASTFIQPDVVLGRDTTVLPFTFIEGRTRIGEGCTIGPSARLLDCVLGNRVAVQISQMVETTVGDDCTIGPFANLRAGADLADHVKVGDFVEIKKSRIGEHSKVPHLSYVGDAHIGRRVNIGAGTITCNYDGHAKHPTEIEDDVRIGSNTNLIAPVRVGRGSSTGAGAVVIRNVPPNSVAVGVPARILERPADAGAGDGGRGV